MEAKKKAAMRKRPRQKTRGVSNKPGAERGNAAVAEALGELRALVGANTDEEAIRIAITLAKKR